MERKRSGVWCGIVRVISKLRDKSQDKNVEKNVKMKSRPHIRSAPVWCATPSGRWHINARLCVLWQCEEERSDELCWLTRELYKSNIWIISHHARYAHAHRTLSLTLHARVIDKQNSNEKSRGKEMWNVCQWASSEIDMTTEWSVSVAECDVGLWDEQAKWETKVKKKKNVVRKIKPLTSAPLLWLCLSRYAPETSIDNWHHLW